MALKRSSRVMWWAWAEAEWCNNKGPVEVVAICPRWTSGGQGIRTEAGHSKVEVYGHRILTSSNR